MQITSIQHLISAPDVDTCPDTGLPEFAFIGRSNVGKSSLINSLANRKNLARVSKTPGRTQLIHLFLVDEKWGLVDLPGYGFVKSSAKAREAFESLIEGYITQRPNLRCTFVLIDSRHKPQQIDLAFTQWLIENQTPFVLVFTKADKLKPAAVQKNIDAFLGAMGEFCDNAPRTFTTSAQTNAGRKDILQFIGQCL